jgi:hypothetical protein
VCYLKPEPFQGWILFYLDNGSNKFLWHIVCVCHIFQVTMRLCSLSCDNLILLMQQQFVVTHTVCQTEIHTLLFSWVKTYLISNCSDLKKKCFFIYFCKNITCLSVVLLGICRVFSVSYETVKWWVMINSCFMSVMSH